jgi:hypothetical protein
VEYDSLRELSDLLPTFMDTAIDAKVRSGTPDALDFDRRKVRALALAQRVRDPRPSRAIELLIVQPLGSQEWNDQIGNAVRAVGAAMRDL